MKSYELLLLENKAWAKEKVAEDPDYFNRLADIQTPEFLWIGCSDSRVPANEITNTQPGEIFVHRNVANMVVHTDVNLLSVLDYAVTYLKVKHVIVCGHYGCGGIKAAMTNHDFKQVLNINDEEARCDRLVELNVREQVMHLAKTSIIQRAWKKEQRPAIHGWVYGLKDGIINPVLEMHAGSPIDDLYTFDDL